MTVVPAAVSRQFLFCHFFLVSFLFTFLIFFLEIHLTRDTTWQLWQNSISEIQIYRHEMIVFTLFISDMVILIVMRCTFCSSRFTLIFHFLNFSNGIPVSNDSGTYWSQIWNYTSTFITEDYMAIKYSELVKNHWSLNPSVTSNPSRNQTHWTQATLEPISYT